MVILGLEKPVEYGSRQIFDPTMANMVLNAQNNYIQAMREDYLQGREDLKEFNKNFGDFFSPIQKDMEWYDRNVTGATRDLINNLYAQGIDPLRSAEGRAAISRWVNSMPVGKINQLKQSADVAKEYLKNYGALDAAGKLDPGYETFLLNGRSLSDWDTLRDGMWDRYSPAEGKTLQEYVHPTFKDIKPHMMSEQEVKDRGYNYNPNYEYTGVSRADMERSLGSWIPGVRNEGLYRYFRQQAKEDLIRSGNANPTEQEIDKRFVENAITADAQMMTPLTREANQFALDTFRTNNDIRAHGAKAAIDYNYAKKMAALNPKGRGNGSGSGRDDDAPNIFREAEVLVSERTKTQSSPWKMKTGMHVQYEPGEQYYQWIDPLIQADQYMAKDKDTGEMWQMYKFQAKDMRRPGSVYEMDDDGTLHAARINDRDANEFVFQPEGNMRATWAGGQYRYFIAGRFVSDDNRNVSTPDGSRRVWIEVKERGYNYGQTQKKE